MPISLWKYITLELWRIIALTGAVLVAVIAFAASIKPMADGKITPVEALQFMGLAIVPMLQYALPFAAGFGATLAYHRLSHDNEVTAAYAGGVSHRAVLMPAIITGVILGVGLLGLNQFIMPRFLRSMEVLIAQNLSKVLVNSVQRGQPVVREGTVLYADRVVALNPEDSPQLKAAGAREWLVLYGVMVLTFDKEGELEREAAANRAQVVLLPGSVHDGGATRAVVQLEQGSARDGDRAYAKFETLPLWMNISNAFKDDPKFLTFGELVELRGRPEGMNWIEVQRRDLAYHVAERVTTEALRKELAARGMATLRDPQGTEFVIRAKDAAVRSPDWRWVLQPTRAGGMIEVEKRLVGAAPTKFTTPDAGLYTDMGGADRLSRSMTMRLELDNVAAGPGTRDQAAGKRTKLVFSELSLVDGPMETLLDPVKTPAAKLLGEARPRVVEAGDEFVKRPYADLEHSIASLLREITSKQNERFAMSVACVVMVVAGAMTAVRLSSSLPLTVYLWSFFPALATVITISSGQQLTHEHGWPGLLVLWGGVGIMGAYAAIGYWRLTRH
ncbi:MAG: LptF/LptG family permease [Phycisphaerales bacterium]|nr:LptF/LptG family permease [Phycisphaerales bacterium]